MSRRCDTRALADTEEVPTASQEMKKSLRGRAVRGLVQTVAAKKFTAFAVLVDPTLSLFLGHGFRPRAHRADGARIAGLVLGLRAEVVPPEANFKS